MINMKIINEGIFYIKLVIIIVFLSFYYNRILNGKNKLLLF